MEEEGAENQRDQQRLDDDLDRLPYAALLGLLAGASLGHAHGSILICRVKGFSGPARAAAIGWRGRSAIIGASLRRGRRPATASMMTKACASGHSSVMVRWMTGDIPAGTIAASRSAAPPVSAMVGLPERRLTTPMSRQNTPWRKPGAERLGAGLLGGEALGIGGGALPPSLRLPPLDVGEDAR